MVGLGSTISVYNKYEKKEEAIIDMYPLYWTNQ